VNPELGIVDLKTCDDLTWFESDARRFHYHHQLAFYQSVFEAAITKPTNGRRVTEREANGDATACCPVYIIAVEKKEPYRCGVWLVNSETLLFARAEIESAIERFKIAQADDHWITGYEELRILNFSA
jgi:hypothetical protein